MTALPTSIAGFDIMDASETNEPNSILVFAHPKRGKTTLAGSLIEVEGFNNVLHIDLEKGSGAMARQYPGVKVIRPPLGNATAVAEILNEIYADPFGLGFDAVIVDTVSTLQKWVKTEWKDKHGGKMEFDGWDFLGEYIMDTMWQLHDMYPLGISLYHTKIDQNETTKQVWTVPYIQGSARHSIASVPDMVIAIDINGKGERVLQMVPKTTMMTGSRYEDVLPANLTGAVTMSTLFDAIRAGVR